ncbi:MAG: flavin-containing monooxygenase [Sporichthyaceae bacterium]
MTEIDVLIVGAGLSGIGAACRLQQECPGTTYLIAEQRSAIGGTWDQFRFPGVRSDSDAYTLSYPFRPWTSKRAISPAADLLKYIRDTAAEFGVDRHIEFDTKVLEASFSSESARWTVRLETAGETREVACRFLYLCTGYFSYDTPFQPEFPGREDFAGDFVHPQFWPEDLDYADKKIVIIGSGATAVTLVPAMSQTAAHVTMLQRTPSYVFTMPGVDAVAVGLQKVLPAKVAHKIAHTKNAVILQGMYTLARKRPETFKKLTRKMALHYLKDEAVVDEHFTPPYQPWDQRLCLVPDGDMFKSIASGKASVVTNHIDRLVPEGVKLVSGEVLEADVIVSATGLTLRPVGGLSLDVDGTKVDVGSTIAYRAMMMSGVPNLAFCFGYSNNSWTLRADLSSSYVCRLLDHMKRNGYDIATPTLPGEMDRTPFLDLNSGYVTRGINEFPGSGTQGPWVVRQNYLKDRPDSRRGDIAKDMVFGVRTPAKDPARV